MKVSHSVNIAECDSCGLELDTIVIVLDNMKTSLLDENKLRTNSRLESVFRNFIETGLKTICSDHQNIVFGLLNLRPTLAYIQKIAGLDAVLVAFSDNPNTTTLDFICSREKLKPVFGGPLSQSVSIAFDIGSGDIEA